MSPPSRTRAIPLLAAAAFALAGCTSEDASPADEDVPTAESTPADESTEPAEATPPSTSPTPATTAPTRTRSTRTSSSPSVPSTSTPTSTPPEPADDSPAARARRSLVAKADMPGFNDSWAWDRSRTTSGPAATPPGACLQASLTAIGGYAEARRDYASTATDEADASMVSVVFPDVQTARTATDVVSAWQQRCRQHASGELGLDDVRVSGTDTVRTRVGTGVHWLVTYRPAPREGDQWYDAEGFVVDGDTMSYVVVRVAGQDYNFAPGRSPVELALEAAGARLERTR